MAKDPAILFYYQDFLVGTEFMIDEDVGKYIRLLCHQADKGKLSEKQVLSICKASVIPESIKEKLQVDEDGLFFNKRMLEEKGKRQKFSESRRNNAKGVKAYAQHMEDENENKDIDIDIDKDEYKDEEIVFNSWNAFADMRGLTKIVKLTDKRVSNINSRLTEKDFDFNHILQRIDESDFLLGKKTNWKIDFDFIFGSKNNWIKIMEGKYGNNTKEVGASPEILRELVEKRAAREQGS